MHFQSHTHTHTHARCSLYYPSTFICISHRWSFLLRCFRVLYLAFLAQRSLNTNRVYDRCALTHWTQTQTHSRRLKTESTLLATEQDNWFKKRQTSRGKIFCNFFFCICLKMHVNKMSPKKKKKHKSWGFVLMETKHTHNFFLNVGINERNNAWF